MHMQENIIMYVTKWKIIVCKLARPVTLNGRLLHTRTGLEICLLAMGKAA